MLPITSALHEEPSRTNALDDGLPFRRDRLLQHFDDAEFFGGFKNGCFNCATDGDYQKIGMCVMEFPNEREWVSR